MNNQTKNMSPAGAALFNAMKSSNPLEQIMALEKVVQSYRPVPTNPATRMELGENV